MKKVLVLTGDYWHPTSSITPILDDLFNKEKWNVTLTENPKDLSLDNIPDLFVTFKDVIENDHIPTPLWCDDEWTSILDDCIKNQGMGFMAVHCGIADIPEDHFITQNILRAFFIAHPEQCPVSFEPVNDELTDGIPTFTFSHVDEHYQIKIVGDTNVLGYSISQHGRQPALWTHQYGKGRVIGITPGHSYENLGQPEYLKLLIRCAEYCAK